MKHSDKRMTAITKWILSSPFISQEPDGDVKILKGRIAELEDDVFIDLYEWLAHEGFEDGTTAEGYFLRYESVQDTDGSETRVIYLRKAETLKAPFALEKPLEPKKTSRAFALDSDEDVPF